MGSFTLRPEKQSFEHLRRDTLEQRKSARNYFIHTHSS